MNVSALMAVFNREETVRDAIESIAVQLTDEDELIISDDGSTDNTLNICETLAQKYHFIKILRFNRKNVDENMFNLINNSTKDICIICDSDDISLPNRVHYIKEHFLKYGDKYPCLYHNAMVIDKFGNVTAKDFFFNFKQRNNLFNSLIKSTFFGTCMCFNTEKTKKLINSGINNFNLARDKKIGFAYKKTKMIKFDSTILLQYRRWEDNISKSNRPLIDKLMEKLVTLQYYIYIKRRNFQ